MFPANRYAIGTQRIAKTMVIFKILESSLFSFLEGFRISLIPKNMVKGNEINPIQVIKVPNGTALLLSKAIVNTEEPVLKRNITIIVMSKLLKKYTFRLFIFQM